MVQHASAEQLAAGNLEATIMLERMWDEIAQHYEVDVLCGYFRSAFANEESISTLERVCAEHTAAHGRELCYSFKLALALACFDSSGIRT